MTSLYNHKKKYKKAKQIEQIKEWRLFKKDIIISYPITISIIIEKMKIAYMLIDIGYLAYEVISSMFIKKAGLEYINISIKKLIGIKGKEDHINKIVKIEIDIDKHK